MKKALVALLVTCAPAAWAGEAIGNAGSIRGDYWTRFHQYELNVVISAIPVLDVEHGLRLPASDAHVAIGPRFEILSRESEAGATIRLVVLFGAWAGLGSSVQLTAFSASPGVEATYWFSRRFGITASVSVPILVPYSSGALDTARTQASPRLGFGFSF